jgi:hypothetical protein
MIIPGFCNLDVHVVRLSAALSGKAAGTLAAAYRASAPRAAAYGPHRETAEIARVRRLR